MILSSRQNPTVKRLLELRDAKGRREQKRFLIDSPRDVERALAKKIEIIGAFLCKNFPIEPNLLPKIKNVPLIEMSKSVFEAICYRENPSGLILEVKIWETNLKNLIFKNNKKSNFAPGDMSSAVTQPSLIILAEDIEKPGNLGTLLRTADAVGADAIIGCNATVELFNPNTLRASAGAAFHVPYATASRAEALSWIAEKKLKLIATSPAAKKLPWECDLKSPLALAIGSEAHGLSKELLAAASETIKLPMNGIGDSLNVSVATGAVLYECVRQRSK